MKTILLTNTENLLSAYLFLNSKVYLLKLLVLNAKKRFYETNELLSGEQINYQ